MEKNSPLQSIQSPQDEGERVYGDPKLSVVWTTSSCHEQLYCIRGMYEGKQVTSQSWQQYTFVEDQWVEHEELNRNFTIFKVK